MHSLALVFSLVAVLPCDSAVLLPASRSSQSAEMKEGLQCWDHLDSHSMFCEKPEEWGPPMAVACFTAINKNFTLTADCFDGQKLSIDDQCGTDCKMEREWGQRPHCCCTTPFCNRPELIIY